MYSVLPLFETNSQHRVSDVGGKAKSLQVLGRNNFKVPDGFIIPTSLFLLFLRETNLDEYIAKVLHEVNYSDFASVSQASAAINEKMQSALFPHAMKSIIGQKFNELSAKYVAVRSSATQEDSFQYSWAGQMESILNVSYGDLFDSIVKCWGSYFSTRALLYRFKTSTSGKGAMAVIVQKMINMSTAGVCFTKHPVTNDNNIVIIEAVFGLGEAVVKGIFTPDTYIVDKRSLKILEKQVNVQRFMVLPFGNGTKQTTVPKELQRKQKLNDKEIRILAETCRDVEKLFGASQDIEWGVNDNNLFILQSRPITTD